MLHTLGLLQPRNGVARSAEDAARIALDIGYPLVVRPSYVLGGRGMEIVHNPADLARYITEAIRVSASTPVLLDRYLTDAIEVDVDCVADGVDVLIGGVMQHVEQAGIHSGDSACSLPPYSLAQATITELKRQTRCLARGLNVVGLMNVQFAIQRSLPLDAGGAKDVIYVLEVNPRASRSVPFVAKATGVALARVGARCMVGQSLRAQHMLQEITPACFSVKEAVFPFARFPGADTLLGPEMKSTGEVMGSGSTFGTAFFKAQMAAGVPLPSAGWVLLHVRPGDLERAVGVAQGLVAHGFTLGASAATSRAIQAAGIAVATLDLAAMPGQISNKEVALLIITVDRNEVAATRAIRLAAVNASVPLFSTMAAAEAVLQSLCPVDGLYSLQALHQSMARHVPAAMTGVAALLRSTRSACIKLFIRQPFTESGATQQRLVEEILKLIDAANGTPLPFQYLTGTRAETADTFRRSFERDQHLPFTPKNFRRYRLNLLDQADALINIRVGMSESSAFEVSYHIFKGRRTPVLFLVWKQAPIKTTLIRELDDLCDVTYLEFEYPHELIEGIQRFFERLKNTVPGRDENAAMALLR